MIESFAEAMLPTETDENPKLNASELAAGVGVSIYG